MSTRSTLGVIGIAAWLLSVLLVPVWRGQIYEPAVLREEFARRAALFDLEGSRSPYERAPMWNPPAAAPRSMATSLRPTVRWPWQVVRERAAHIEIDVARMILDLSAGIVVAAWLGFMGPYRARRFESLLMHAACALIVAWAGVGMVHVYTRGLGHSDEIVLAVVAIALAGGFLCEQRQARLPAAAVDAPTAIPAIVPFTAGVLAGSVLALALLVVAEPFRGPVETDAGTGTVVFEWDQSPIDVAVGVATAVLGWLLGLILVRAGARVPAAAGLIAAANLCGVLIIVAALVHAAPLVRPPNDDDGSIAYLRG